MPFGFKADGMRKVTGVILLICLGCTTSLKAQIFSKIFREFHLGIGTHYGAVYVNDPYVDLSNYMGTQLSLQTASLYNLHLYTELKYTQTQIGTQSNPLKLDDYSYPHTDYLKTISIPIYLGYETQQYNYNSYYFRVGFASVFHQLRGNITEFNTDTPFYYGFQLGTHYDFMNHLVASITLQYEAHPILYKDISKTGNIFGLQLQLSYKH